MFNNKKSFLITYSVNENFDTTSLHNEIQRFELWGRVTETSWIVITELKPNQIRDIVFQFLPSDSRLFVTKVVRNAAWTNVICSNEWLLTNMNLI